MKMAKFWKIILPSGHTACHDERVAVAAEGHLLGYLLPEEQLETQKAENKILRQKLQSKSEALVKRSGFLYSKNAFLL